LALLRPIFSAIALLTPPKFDAAMPKIIHFYLQQAISKHTLKQVQYVLEPRGHLPPGFGIVKQVKASVQI
jgi:hypothetical protein